MEIDKEGDVRVVLVFVVFFLCVTTGGVFLFIYVFVPSLSQSWYQSAAIFLIAAPWIFWFLTFLYTVMKHCCAPRPPLPADHKISRLSSTTTGGSSQVPLTNPV
ncbi:hypothetical protein AAHA92_28593 [Salvia divinorum]|uniref:Uncharacterized protein n=1 Tax=Salvia divinorum TaxID=28513 RepID=A0ABD1FVM6_SALDI